MPIEIRELVIRARVDPDHDGSMTSALTPAARDTEWQAELVQACVKEVLRILEDKRER
jgi:hypothetical protein